MCYRFSSTVSRRQILQKIQGFWVRGEYARCPPILIRAADEHSGGDLANLLAGGAVPSRRPHHLPCRLRLAAPSAEQIPISTPPVERELHFSNFFSPIQGSGDGWGGGGGDFSAAAWLGNCHQSKKHQQKKKETSVVPTASRRVPPPNLTH